MSSNNNNSIHWFPGHMTKALRLIEANAGLCDVIVYVLDSRAPYSCLNPSLDSVIGGKPIVYALNKADLTLPSKLRDVAARLTVRGNIAAAIDSTKSNDAKIVVSLIKRICKARLDKFAVKGVKIALRAMVVGVPNSGKSTLINNLAGLSKTVVGNRPGVTRGKQWVRVDDYLEVLDTPGTLYPKIEDQETAYKLAAIGSIKDDVVDTNELAVRVIKMLDGTDPAIINTRYNIARDDGINGDELVAMIAKKRGYLMQGGVADIDRASAAIVDDLRKGRLGKVFLD